MLKALCKIPNFYSRVIWGFYLLNEGHKSLSTFFIKKKISNGFDWPHSGQSCEERGMPSRPSPRKDAVSTEFGTTLVGALASCFRAPLPRTASPLPRPCRLRPSLSLSLISLSSNERNDPMLISFFGHPTVARAA